ncbi:MAG: alpha-2-macroglobulin family protein, partial [Chloroflexota bacterium]
TKAFHVDPAFPRFLISGDHVSLAATVTNATAGDVAAIVTLSSPSLQTATPATQHVSVPASGSRVVRWDVTAGSAGDAAITLQAAAGSLTDAVKISIPVMVGGATASVTAADEAGNGAVALDLPASAITGSAALQLAVTPSLAGGVLAASRSLSAYPYACAEQTVSSYLPAILAKETYTKAGLSALQQQLPPDLASRVETSLQQLYSLQHADGGWNWWSYDQTDPYMTAYVVHGLAEAKRLGYPVVQSNLERGIASLQRQLDPSTAGLATAAYMLDVLALAGKPVGPQSPVVQGLLARHSAMADYGESYLAQYFVAVGDPTDARSLLASLSREATQTSTTASWKEQVDLPPLRGSLVYSTAAALDAFTLLDAGNPLALKAARYLLAARSGDAWNSTHDSAMATMALQRFLLAHGDFAASGNVRVIWNGQVLQEAAVTPTTPPLAIHLAAQQVQSKNSLQIT